MSVRDLCQVYLSSTSSGNWKSTLSDIGTELEANNHPDFQMFVNAACSLMMNDKPGYRNWLNVAIAKLIEDSTARLEPLPVLPDYEELSSVDLVEKYESNDGNYSKQEISYELKERYPSALIELNGLNESKVNLREILKDVL